MSSPGYSAISSYSRVQILQLLQERTGRTIAELCEATGLHANTVREHLQRLIDAGYVIPEREQRTTRGRPRVLYSAVSGTDAAASPVAQRKARDAAARGDLMRRVLPETGADVLPAEAMHQIDALVEDLGDAGFDPLVDERALTLDLSPCGHAAAHPERRDELCGVHLGLMQGVLTGAGGPLEVDGMHDSCNPAQCVVQLRRR